MILTEQKRIVVEYWWNDSDRAKENCRGVLVE